MKLPICNFDAKSGILCPKCQSKLKSGQLTQADVDISMKLVKMVSQLSELDRLSLVKAFEVNGSNVLIISSSDIAAVRADYSMIKAMENALGSKIWLLGAEAGDRKMLEDLFHPVRILTVNQVWIPGGSKLTRVVIPGRWTERFPIDIERAKEIMKTVRGMNLLVEFEKK